MANDQSIALLTEAEKLAQVTDRLTGQFALELSRALRDLERELRTLGEAAVAGSQTALSRAVRAGKLRVQVQKVLRESGYARLATTATSGRLDALIAQVERLRGAAELAAFSTSDMTRILALRELATMDLLAQLESSWLPLWRTLTQSILSARSSHDLVQDLADALEIEEAKARTLYDTTVSVYGRQVEAMKARPDDVFLFVGPLDRKTRKFCREHVGKVYTRAEIDALDNGQLPNTFLTCGGYACRHVFQAVSKVSTLRELVGTGRRMPEVEERIRLMERGGNRAA